MQVLEVQAQTEAPKLALEDLIADQPNELAEPEEQQPAEQQQVCSFYSQLPHTYLALLTRPPCLGPAPCPCICIHILL